jgi:hypothetical protein
MGRELIPFKILAKYITKCTEIIKLEIKFEIRSLTLFQPPLFSNLLAPWNRILLEKQRVIQLVKKFCVFYGT